MLRGPGQALRSYLLFPDSSLLGCEFHFRLSYRLCVRALRHVPVGGGRGFETRRDGPRNAHREGRRWIGRQSDCSTDSR